VSLLRASLAADAVLRIERFMSPKWRSEAECKRAYRRAMDEKRSAALSLAKNPEPTL
jgi:hypothetical protein